MNFCSDIELPDSRTYEVQLYRMRRANAPACYVLEVELLEKRRQLFLDFRFFVYESAFERGYLSRERDSILQFCRRWLKNWLTVHPCPVRMVKISPVVVDLR